MKTEPFEDSGMSIKLKLPYKLHQQVKKAYGQKLGIEIAVGRKLVKILKEKYA